MSKDRLKIVFLTISMGICLKAEAGVPFDDSSFSEDSKEPPTSVPLGNSKKSSRAEGLSAGSMGALHDIESDNSRNSSTQTAHAPITPADLLNAVKSSPSNIDLQNALCKACEDIVLKEPHNSEARRLFGVALACHGNYDDAKYEFKQASDLSEGHSKYSAEQNIAQLKIVSSDPKARTSEDWFKAAKLKILNCPRCYRTRRIIPAIYPPVKSFQSAAVAAEAAYLLPEGTQKTSISKWYCKSCKKVFESAESPSSAYEYTVYDVGPATDLVKQISSRWLPLKDQDGKATLARFNLHQDGHITDCQIAKSSGSKDMDQAVYRLLTNPNMRARANKRVDTLDVTVLFEADAKLSQIGIVSLDGSVEDFLKITYK